MSLAHNILSQRIKERKEKVQRQVAEATELAHDHYQNKQLSQRLAIEQGKLAQLESALIKERDELVRQLVNTKNRKSPSGEVLPREEYRSLAWWKFFCRPWSFVWRIVLILGTIGCILLGVWVRAHPTFHWVYSAAMAGCVPITVCVFFTELARRIDLKGWWVVVTFLFGGIFSILLTMIVNRLATFLPDQASWAGVVEEPCKGAVLLVLWVALTQVKSAFAGLALGAAVGAGFATIETFQYAYYFGAQGMPSTFVLIYRGIISPVMHTGWSAALGGALWYINFPEDAQRRKLKRCCDTLVVFILMILCHGLWNWSPGISALPLVVWVIILFYLKRGSIEMRLRGKAWPQ